MATINVTDENAEAVRDNIIYAAAVVANIRTRLEKYNECIMDDKDILKIWAVPWLEATGNLHERIKRLAKEIGANVTWPKKGEAHFTRKVPYYILSQDNNGI